MGMLYKTLHVISNNRFVVSLFFSILLFLAFYFVSVKVKQDRFNKINFDTTIRLQHKIPARFDELFEDAAFFVSPVISSLVVCLLTVMAFVDIKKKRVYLTALLIPLTFALMIGIEVYGKDRVESPAPPYFMIKNPTTIFPKYHVIDQYSYPSGHASRALFIGGTTFILLWKSLYKRVKLLGLFGLFFMMSSFVLFISIGKIYLGQHWLSDIIGGWIVAAAFLSIIYGTRKTY